MVQQAGFGLPTMGTVPAGLLDALYPYLTYLPNLTSQLAQSQFGEQGAIQRAQIAADAARSGDAQRANATVAAAGIGAGAQVESQLIQVKGMLKATQASLIADLEKARNGDIAAGQRYQAGLTQEANLRNQATVLELSKMMGSGQLRDNIGARLALRGMGPMPGISSALNGMENRLWATAPTVGTPPMYNAPKIDMGGLGGGGNYGSNIPTFSSGGGGGGYAPQTSSMGDLYGDLFSKIKSTVGFGDIFKFGAPQAPAAPVTSPAATLGLLKTDPLAGLNATRAAAGLPPLATMPAGDFDLGPTGNKPGGGFAKASRGGRFGKGQNVLVGEEGPEIMRVGQNAVDVIPLDRTAAKGGTFGYPPRLTTAQGAYPKRLTTAQGATPPNPTPTREEYIDPNRPQLGFKPKVNAIPTGGLGPKPISPGASKPFGYGPATETGGKWTDTRFDQPAPSTWSSGGGWLDRMKAKAAASNQPSKKFGAPPAEAPAPAPPPPVVVIQPTPQAPVVQPQAPLADVNTIPALQQIRSGKVLPAFGIGPTSFSEPGLGITDTPAPYLSASTFQAMAPDEQEDTLQLWEMLGIPRIKALFEMMSSTPGARQYPQKAFGFA